MDELSVRTCVSSSGEFVYGIHKPDYTVVNLREKDHITTLGRIDDKTAVENKINFPANDVIIDNADWVFEISNPFPFMGATFILKSSADKKIENANPFDIINKCRTATDTDLLVELAKKSCLFEFDPHTGEPAGIQYEKAKNGGIRQAIKNHHLFEIVSNNPFYLMVISRQWYLSQASRAPIKLWESIKSLPALTSGNI